MNDSIIMNIKYSYAVSRGIDTRGYHTYTVNILNKDTGKYNKTKYKNCYYGSNCAFSALYSYLLDTLKLTCVNRDYYCYCPKMQVKRLLEGTGYMLVETNLNKDVEAGYYYFDIYKINTTIIESEA
jgi:hypothetical protein